MKNEKFTDKLFDDNNEERVHITDEDGRDIEFEQVAVVDYEGAYYAILKPVTELEGVSDDEVLIFFIDEENDKLVYVEDEDVGDGVMDVFYEMLEEYDEE